jgi:glycosyltransferase involved in cell wall biosynthesis
MRVALFSEVFLPKIDGVVNTVCYLLKHLAERGHEAVLFTAGDGPTSYAGTPVLRRNGIPFLPYPPVELVLPIVDLSDDLESFAPDVVHAINPVALGLAGMWWSRREAVPVVASYHTDVAGFAARWGLGVLQEPIWLFFRWVHDQADLNLCPSRVTLAELQTRGFPRLKVWTRGVDTVRFSPKHRSEEWRWRLSGGRPDAPLLLYVGRVSPEKRVDWLRPVLAELPEACLAIVGDGPARPVLEEAFAGTRTVFTGFLYGEHLAQAYAAADVFVFPGANETLGNVVLEAMASGLPVVTPRAGGPLDLVEDGVTGLFFEPEDPSSMLECVRWLLMEPLYASDIARAAREYALGRSWNTVLDGLLDDYATLVDSYVLEAVA